MLTYNSFEHIVLHQTKTKEFCLALSGGVDSSVLLNLFYQLRLSNPTIQIRAVHIQHGLSPFANHWARTCSQLCQTYQIPLEIHEVVIIKKSQQSLEELARNERYRQFKQVLKQQEILVTAHHENDQAETLLIQLFRGCGPKGLASMPMWTTLGKGFLFRPLLTFSKQAMLNFAQEEQLTWIEDESNSNCAFDRNFIRQELLPLIQSRWPKVVKNLARTASHCASAERLIESNLVQIFNQIFDPLSSCLRISLLRLYDEDMQNYLIRYWLQKLNLSLPNTKKLTQLREQFLHCRQDAAPHISWKDVEVRRYRDYLYASTTLIAHDASLVLQWDLKNDLILPNNLGKISLDQLKQHGLNLAILEEVTIRFRQGGERCRLAARQHSHSLKKLFQVWRIPPWQRERVPLLYVRDKLKAIIGYAICE